MKNKICFVSVDVENGLEDFDKILDTFKKNNLPATLFVTGEVLAKHGQLVKEWSEDYEIACHSFTHRFWNTLSPEERKNELEDFINLYQKIFQRKPLGFRAPSHIIDAAGLKLLEEKGFLYDSSILPHYPPFKKYRGYLGRKPLNIHFIGGLLETPVRGQVFGIPLAGAWISKLPFFLYQILFLIYQPSFITLNMHSWDVSDNRFLGKLKKIIRLLEKKNYLFLNGEQILKNRK